MKTKMEQGWSMGGVPTNPWRPVPTVVFALSPEELGQLSGRGHNEVAPSLDAAMAAPGAERDRFDKPATHGSYTTPRGHDRGIP